MSRISVVSMPSCVASMCNTLANYCVDPESTSVVLGVSGVEREAHSGDEAYSGCGICCCGQPCLLQGEYLHASGGCQEDM